MNAENDRDMSDDELADKLLEQATFGNPETVNVLLRKAATRLRLRSIERKS